MNSMNVFTEGEAKLRETDKAKVVRSWNASNVLRNIRGEITVENPDYHPYIGQCENGSYVNANDVVIPKSKVPDYILAQGRPQKHQSTAKVVMTFEEAETNHVANDAPAKRGPGRPRKGTVA